MKIGALFSLVLLSAFPSLAQTPPPPLAGAQLEAPRDRWAPTAVTKEDRRGLTRLAKEIDHAWEERHLDDASAHMAFPVLMVTDDGRGRAVSEPWTRERWLRVMGDVVNALPPDAKLRTTRLTFAFVTNALATIHQERQLVSGKKKTRWRTTYVCVRDGDAWRVTAIVEGGFAASGKPAP